MDITAVKGDILGQNADLLVVGVYHQENWENAFVDRLNESLSGKFRKFAKIHEFSGEAGQSMLFPAPSAFPAEYILVVGLGSFEMMSLEVAREATGVAVQTAQRLGLASIAIELFGEDEGVANFHARNSGDAIATAALLCDYQFINYKKPKGKKKVQSLTIVAEDGRDAKNALRGVENAIMIVGGVTVARDLVNTPAKDMSPSRLAEAAQALAGMSSGLVKAKILDREACEKKNMGAFLAVSQGSIEEPKFIHLIYKPKKTTKKIIALVGKGVTFDSGGLSLKPANYMESMKCDMAGAAAVLGVFAILPRLQPNMEIHGIIAATENMPGGRAIRPGDIVKASNGKTIEILNTDAEGRLTLADALHYACELGPSVVIDMATLTGSCMVALGEEVAGLMSPDAKLANQILSSAADVGERMWELPLEPRYRRLIESDIADYRNIATSAYGGTLTAGLFLKEFVDPNVRWAHVDVAGPAYAERPIGSYLSKGGTGYGVRTMVNLIENL